MEEMEQKQREAQEQKLAMVHQGGEGDEETDEGDEETDDEEEDYGPTPVAGVWAGSEKLQAESELMGDDEVDTPATKKQRID